MILGIGIDTIEINRFDAWYTKPQKQVHKIFNQQEYLYCISTIKKSSERFAVRFAAKEACYKALSSFLPETIPFIRFCSLVTIQSIHNKPCINLEPCIQALIPAYQLHLSLTHSKTIASAVVILEKRDS